MATEFKVIICIIVTIWLFSMGILTGEYVNRDKTQSETTAVTDVAASQPSAGESSTQPLSQQSAEPSGSASVTVTDAYGNAVTDANGVVVTQMQSAPQATVTVTDQSGQPVTDSNGAAVTETVPSSQSGQVSQPQGTTPSGTQNGELIDGRFTNEAMYIKSGKFYIEAKEFDNGETLDMKFASDNGNSQVYTTISGADISLMIIDGEMYMVYNDSYVKLSQSLMSTAGIDLDDYNFDAKFLTELFDDNAQAKVETAELDGKKLTKTSYNTAKYGIVIYSDGNELVQIEKYDLSTGDCKEIIYVDSVTNVLPQYCLTTDGMKKKSFISFFTELMKATGEDLTLEQ